MKPEEIIKEFRTRLEVLKADTTKLYKTLPGLFQAAEALAVLNKEEASKLKTKLLELNSLTDSYSINLKIDEIIVELSKINYTQKSKEKTYLGVSQRFYTEEYKQARKTYEAYTHLIDKKENEIITATEYNDRLHEPLKIITKKYGKCLHARLTGNLRILYNTDRKKDIAIFLTIIPHDKMDKL